MAGQFSVVFGKNVDLKSDRKHFIGILGLTVSLYLVHNPGISNKLTLFKFE